MPRNRAARRRAARRAPRTPFRRQLARSPQGPARVVARVAAAALGLGMIAVSVAVLATPVRAGNPGRAARGLVLVIALGAVLLWWGATGRGL